MHLPPFLNCVLRELARHVLSLRRGLVYVITTRPGSRMLLKRYFSKLSACNCGCIASFLSVFSWISACFPSRLLTLSRLRSVFPSLCIYIFVYFPDSFTHQNTKPFISFHLQLTSTSDPSILWSFTFLREWFNEFQMNDAFFTSREDLSANSSSVNPPHQQIYSFQSRKNFY